MSLNAQMYALVDITVTCYEQNNKCCIIILYYKCQIMCCFKERSGSVVECLTRDRGAAGSSLTDVTALWSMSKTHLS